MTTRTTAGPGTLEATRATCDDWQTRTSAWIRRQIHQETAASQHWRAEMLERLAAADCDGAYAAMNNLVQAVRETPPAGL